MKNVVKQTEIDEIPVGWNCSSIIELGGNLKDCVQTGPFGAQLHSSDYIEEGVPLLLIRNITNEGLNRKGLPRISVEDASRLSKYSLKENDLVFSRVGRVGSCFLVTREERGWIISGQLLRIRLKAIDIDYTYIYYALRSERVQSYINGASVGSTRESINTTILENLRLLLPTLQEQQKIAKILSTLDEKMAVIDEQLAQTQELKKGLMQHLLTKGVGHTQFKNSLLGQIPASWEIHLLDEVTKRGSGHTPSKSFPEYYNGGIKWVSLADSVKLDNGWIKETKTEISSLGIKNSSATLHPKGTVLLSRDAGIGKSAVMHEDMAVSQHFITWTCNGKINNWFLYYYLQLNKPLFERIAAGSTIKTIGLPFFKKFSIPVPTAFEQEKIAEILITVDDKISVLQDKKAQYYTLKKGLMQQLLTGQRRVRVAEQIPALV